MRYAIHGLYDPWVWADFILGKVGLVRRKRGKLTEDIYLQSLAKYMDSDD